ncbi:MAG: dihydrodipicolinate synthase family protein [Streptosporangiaceae bacterium]
MSVFSGVGVALLTMRDSADEPDAAATAEHAAALAARGMRAVLACGTTGEANRLSDDQRSEIISAVRAAMPASTPVIAGTGAVTPGRAVELTARAVKAGADAVLAWPPPGSDDLAGFYGAVRDAAAGLPVLAYHVPWVSAPGVPLDALASLPVAGLKDSSGDPDRLLAELAHYRGDVYVGSSAILALAGPMGAAGAILAVANVAPELCAAAFSGSGQAQLELADVHLATRGGGPSTLLRMLAELN